jgi:heme A synthase
MNKLTRFAKYAWFLVVYLVFVNLAGVLVRATGSGAGCGSHWPLCNGEVTPSLERLETVIELSHRLVAALAGVLVIILLVWALRRFPRGHRVRQGAWWTFVFILMEGAAGAALVRFEWVADDVSLGRVIAMSVHLIITFILVAVAGLAAWWASGGMPVRVRGQGQIRWWLLAGFIGMFLLGVSGSITALGDTIFPSASLAEGIARDFSATAHFLERLRVYHPIIAVFTGLYLAVVAGVIRGESENETTRRLALSVNAVFLLQLGVGMVNLVLLAPIWMQLVHLAMAVLVWMNWVLLAASRLSEPALEGRRMKAEVGESMLG